MLRVSVLVIVLLGLVTTGDRVTPAQDATPEAGTPHASPVAGAAQVDLAAMTLDSAVMPAGYTLAAEYFTHPDQLAQNLVRSDAGISVEEIDALTITGYYESYYATADGSKDIRFYVIAYETSEDVQAGFNLIEDEARTIPEEVGIWEDEPGPAGVGQAPSEITTATLQIPDGPTMANVDVTFRLDRFHLGVALSVYGDDAAIEPADRALVEELAAELAERVGAVLAGADVAGIDPSLPSLMPTFGTLDLHEGYQTLADAFGEQATAIDADTFVSAYARGGSFAADPGVSPAPILSVGVARFTDAAAVLDVLGGVDALVPAERGYERGEVDEVAGHPAASFAYISGYGPGGADSVQVFVAVDDLLISVWAEGITSVEAAEELALGFAEEAVACVTEGTACGPYDIPSDLAAPAATPEAVALPMADDREA